MKKKMRNRRVNNDRKDCKTPGRGFWKGSDLKLNDWMGGLDLSLHATVVSLVVITGFLTAFLNRCLLFFLFFIRIVLALLCLPGSFCSCTTNLPSTFLSFGVRLPSPLFPHHFSLPSHLPGPPLSCLLMSWALASRLFSLLSLPLAVCGRFVQMGKA